MEKAGHDWKAILASLEHAEHNASMKPLADAIKALVDELGLAPDEAEADASNPA